MKKTDKSNKSVRLFRSIIRLSLVGFALWVGYFIFLRRTNTAEPGVLPSSVLVGTSSNQSTAQPAPTTSIAIVGAPTPATALIEIAPLATASPNAQLASTNAVSPTDTVEPNVNPTQIKTTIKLPCPLINFLSNSTQLGEDSIRALGTCVLPLMQQHTKLRLRVVGSAAWPLGNYTEAQIKTTGQARAQAISNYLISQGVSTERILVESVLPPASHRNTTDSVIQAEDRSVKLSLIDDGSN